MMATVTVSIGNSSTRWGLWSGTDLIRSGAVPTAELDAADLFAGAAEKAEAAAVVSVVPGAEPRVNQLLMDRFGVTPAYLGRELAVPLQLEVDEPGAVGADRLSAALAAVRRCGTAVVVDFGTAITVDAVTADGRFLGGAILPGAELCRRSLATGTAGVQVSAPVEAAEVPGRNTRDAVNAALSHGLAGAVDRLVERTAAALEGKAALVATGGGCALLAPLCKSQFQLLPDLVLEGLLVALADAGI
jgi:type III pantothenate kinase